MKKESKVRNTNLFYRKHPEKRLGIEIYRLESNGRKTLGTIISIEEIDEVIKLLRQYKEKYGGEIGPRE